MAAVQTSITDVAGGFGVLLIFALGTSIYLRRLEIWLQARGSGDAMDLAGSGPGDRALAANAVDEAAARRKTHDDIPAAICEQAIP